MEDKQMNSLCKETSVDSPQIPIIMVKPYSLTTKRQLNSNLLI